MKAPFKLIFLSLLFLTSTICLKAQEKYDYAVVTCLTPSNSTKLTLLVSISGKEFEKIELSKDASKNGPYDYTALLNYVQKMTNEGWKVINTPNVNQFVLEKKRN